MRRPLAGRVALVALAVAVLSPALSTSAHAAPGPATAPEYWFDDWQVSSLWRDGARGQGVTIAEIDTGVNAELPELTGRVLAGMDLGGVGGDGHIDRDRSRFGHGTAMASIMVARPGTFDVTGLAPAAKVLPIAIPLNGTTDAQDDDNLPEAIRNAVDHGAKIISMSLSGAGDQRRSQASCPSDEQDAILYAVEKGAVLFAASGNNGPTSNAAAEPGVCLGVVSVGAVDSAGKVAGFSSRHPYLTLTAPGVAIASLSRIAGTAYSGEGTSQATAITSAVAALVWSKYPKLSARGLVTRLLATLDHRRTTRDPAYGLGTLNAYRAVTTPAGELRTGNPVYAAVAPFLARRRALVPAQTPPLVPARSVQRPPGTVVVDANPRLSTARVQRGVEVGAAGLLSLVVLVPFGAVRRRRRRRRDEPPGLSPSYEPSG